MLGPYRSIDLYPNKIGVESIIHGFLFKFKPWYHDGHSVWWGKEYDLKSDAEKAAYILKEDVDNSKI